MPTGIFTPRDTCITCGRTKPAGRTALTCGPCAAERQRIITTKGSDRTPIMRSDCASCGDPFNKPNTRSLCTRCSVGFAEWKASGALPYHREVSESSDTPTYPDACVWMVKHRLVRPSNLTTRARIIEWCVAEGFPETPVSESSDTSNQKGSI